MLRRSVPGTTSRTTVAAIKGLSMASLRSSLTRIMDSLFHPSNPGKPVALLEIAAKRSLKEEFVVLVGVAEPV